MKRPLPSLLSDRGRIEASDAFIVILGDMVVEGIATVRDGGTGIPPELRRKVTGRFVRGAATADARGFGVGLWLVRKIARDHGGDLKLGGPEGIRVTFRRAGG